MPGNLKDVHACFEEALRIGGFEAHGPVIIRPTVVNLMTVLDGTTVSDTEEYQVPPSMVFLIKEARAHLAFKGWVNEVAVGAAVLGTSGIVGPTDRIDLKATNCKIKLESISGSRKITEEADISLYDVLRKPIRWDELGPGFVLAPGHKLKLTAAWHEATAAIAGDDTEVGLLLSGVLLEVL